MVLLLRAWLCLASIVCASAVVLEWSCLFKCLCVVCCGVVACLGLCTCLWVCSITQPLKDNLLSLGQVKSELDRCVQFQKTLNGARATVQSVNDLLARSGASARSMDDSIGQAKSWYQRYTPKNTQDAERAIY